MYDSQMEDIVKPLDKVEHTTFERTFKLSKIIRGTVHNLDDNKSGVEALTWNQSALLLKAVGAANKTHTHADSMLESMMKAKSEDIIVLDQQLESMGRIGNKFYTGSELANKCWEDRNLSIWHKDLPIIIINTAAPKLVPTSPAIQLVIDKNDGYQSLVSAVLIEYAIRYGKTLNTDTVSHFIKLYKEGRLFLSPEHVAALGF